LGGGQKMRKDPIIERIRAVRHQISAEYNHDPKKLLAHYRRMEKRYKGRMLKEKAVKSNVG
jgi:hypothetical protein